MCNARTIFLDGYTFHVRLRDMNLVGGMLERAKEVERRDPALAASIRLVAEMLLRRTEKK